MRPTFASKQASQKTLDALDFEPVDLEEAKQALDRDGLIGNLAPTKQLTQSHSANPEVKRQAPPKQDLPTETVRWALTLPIENRPLFILTHYPKIANKLAGIWSDRTSVQAYFDDLMLDHRGDRAGFPREAFDDLMRLQQLLLPTSVPSNAYIQSEPEFELPGDSPLARLMARVESANPGKANN